jgi:hypothetical protein
MCASSAPSASRLKTTSPNKYSEETCSISRNGLPCSTGRLGEGASRRPRFLRGDWWLPPLAVEDDVVEAHRWRRCWKIALLCVSCFIVFFYFWWKSLFLLGTLARLVRQRLGQGS